MTPEDRKTAMVLVGVAVAFLAFPIAYEGETDAGQAMLHLSNRRMLSQLRTYSGVEYVKERAIFNSGVLQAALAKKIDDDKAESSAVYYQLQYTLAYWLATFHAYGT